MIKEYLLVDGYNIIYAWNELKEIANENLENARLKLLDIMCNYQGSKSCHVVVVFDAHKVKGQARRIYKHHNIQVVFTKEAETADELIERITYQMGQEYRIRVATSDALEQIIIMGKGATRVSARELLTEVQQLNKQINDEYINTIDVDNNRLEGYLDPKLKKWMEEMRRQ